MFSYIPGTYAKSTNILPTLKTAKSELNKGTSHYVYPALEGKLVPSSSLYPVLNNIKEIYESTRKQIIASSLSNQEKQKNIKELDSLYQEKIQKGLVPYIDAYNYATKYLEPLLIEIEAAEKKNDLHALEKAYHKLSVQLKSRSSILYRFSGKASRDLLLEQYKKTADSKRDELIMPITIYMKTVTIKELLNAGKKVEAKAEFESITELIEKLQTSTQKNSIIKLLIIETTKLQEQLGIISDKEVKPQQPAQPNPDEKLNPPLPGSGEGNSTKNVTGILNKIDGKKVYIDGENYQISKDLLKFFSDYNKPALENAVVNVEVRKGEISKITGLQLNTNNGLNNAVYLAGYGIEIYGNVEILGDNYILFDLTINGDLVIASPNQLIFTSDNLTVNGTTKIMNSEKQHLNNTIQLYFSKFKKLEISRENMLNRIINTKISSLHLNSDVEIFTDELMNFPEVIINENVKNLKLNTSINMLIVNSLKEVRITGKSNIDKIDVNNNKTVTLNTNGAIQDLKVNNKEATIILGSSNVVGNLELPTGKKANDVLLTYEEDISKIARISGEINNKFNPYLWDKLNLNAFTIKTSHVPERFGYIKFDIQNQKEYKVKYTLNEFSYPKPNIPKVGEQVSKSAKEYKLGDEFILWKNHDLIIYLVDAEDKILEVIDEEEYYWNYSDEVILNKDNEVKIRTTSNVKNKSVSEIIKYFNFFQDSLVIKEVNFRDYNWSFEDGIPTLILNLPQVNAKSPSWYYLSGNGVYSYRYLNEGYRDEKLQVNILYDMLEDKNTSFNQNISNFLQEFYYNWKEYPFDPTQYQVKFDSLSMGKYKQELVENKLNLQTAKAIIEMIDKVNLELKDKTTSYEEVKRIVDSLFRYNSYLYPYEEQLRDGVTLKEIQDALKAIEKLDTGLKEEKESLKFKVREALYLFYLPMLKEALVKEYDLAADVSVGTVLTSKLLKDNEESKNFSLKVVAVGQKLNEHYPSNYVEPGARFLGVNDGQLILNVPNNTGRVVTEYVQVELFNELGTYGSYVVKVDIESGEADDSTLSNSVKLHWRGYLTYIFATDSYSQEKLVSIYRGTTVEQLLSELSSDDYSIQSYSIKNKLGVTLLNSDHIEEGDVLTVTSENGLNTADYYIQKVISLTDIEQGNLGEVTFTALNTTIEELQENLRLIGSNEKLSIEVLNSSSFIYKVVVPNAQHNIPYYFFGVRNHQIKYHNNPLIWRTFNIEKETNQLFKISTIDQQQENMPLNIDVKFKLSHLQDWQDEVTIDGISLSSILSDVTGKEGRVSLITTGEDLGEVEGDSFVNVKVIVNGQENTSSVFLIINSKGEIGLQLNN